MTNQTYRLCTLCLSVCTLYSFTYTCVFYCYVFYNILWKTCTQFLSDGYKIKEQGRCL